MDITAVKRALTISLSVTLIVTLVIAMQPTSTVKAASKKVKITWDANSGKIGKDKKKVISYNKGSKIKKLQTAKKTGHTFKGWYTKKSSGTKVTKKTKAKKNTTFYARWTVNQYMLSYDANGGTPSPKFKMVSYDKPYGTLPSVSRSGYKFKGWYTAKNGGIKVSATSKMPAKNVVIYAQWGQTTISTKPEEYDSGSDIPWDKYGFPVGIAAPGTSITGRQTHDGILIIEFRLDNALEFMETLTYPKASGYDDEMRLVYNWIEYPYGDQDELLRITDLEILYDYYGGGSNSYIDKVNGSKYCKVMYVDNGLGDPFVAIIVALDYHRFFVI